MSRHARQANSKEMNPTEALFGFMSWLTTREDPVTLSSHNEPTDILSLLEEWIDEHDLPECRLGWEESIHNMNNRHKSGISHTPPIHLMT